MDSRACGVRLCTTLAVDATCTLSFSLRRKGWSDAPESRQTHSYSLFPQPISHAFTGHLGSHFPAPHSPTYVCSSRKEASQSTLGKSHRPSAPSSSSSPQQPEVNTNTESLFCLVSVLVTFSPARSHAYLFVHTDRPGVPTYRRNTDPKSPAAGLDTVSSSHLSSLQRLRCAANAGPSYDAHAVAQQSSRTNDVARHRCERDR